MRKEAINTWTEGLVKDLHPLNTPNNVLTDALNATLITYDGNEFILQNDLGNGRVETARLPNGFVPVGMKEYGGIIYVASVNPLTGISQIGSFPSPERQISTSELAKGLQISGNLTTSSAYLRMDIGDYKLNPGDKFIIGGTLSNYINAISQYNNNGNKLFKIHIGIVDKENNIIYIEDDLRKHSNGYWIYNGNIDTLTDWQAFTEKTSGYLSIIVEMETIDSFEVTREFSYTAGRDNKENARFGVTFNGNIQTQSEVTANQYKVEYTLNNGPTQTSYSNTGLVFSMNDFTKYDVLTYKLIPYLKWNNYGLGYANAYAVSGGISFAMLGTGYCNLQEWRYYIDDDLVKISWGLDIDPLRKEIVSAVNLHFFNFTTEDYQGVYKCSNKENYNGNFVENIPFKKSTEQGFSLIPNSLYYVAIEIQFKDKDTGEKSDSVWYQKFMYTTKIFNKHYLDLSIKDYENLYLEGLVSRTVDIIDKNIQITPSDDNINIGDLLIKDESTLDFYHYKSYTFSTKVSLKVNVTLENADLYFGSLNTDLYKSELTMTDDDFQEPDPGDIGYLGTNLTLSDKLNEKTQPLAAWIPGVEISKSDDMWEFTISKNGEIKRGIYCSGTSEATTAISAFCLKPYYDETAEPDYSKIGAYVKYDRDHYRITRALAMGSKGFGALNFSYGGDKNEGSPEAISLYTGTTPNYSSLVSAIQKFYPSNPTVAVLACDPTQDLVAHVDGNCLGTIVRSPDKENGSWGGDYHYSGGDRDLNFDYLLVAWKTSNSDYQIINLGGVRFCGFNIDDNDWSGANSAIRYNYPEFDLPSGGASSGSGESRTLYEILAKILSQFYVAKYTNWESANLVPDKSNIIYHSQFNSKFSYTIPSLDEVIVDNTKILKYINSKGEEKFLNSTTAASLISTWKTILKNPTFKNDIKYNNLRFSEDGNVSFIDKTEESIIEFETGSQLSLDDFYSAYQNVDSYIEQSSDVVFDKENGNTTINGKPIKKDAIYIYDKGSGRNSTFKEFNSNWSVSVGGLSLTLQPQWFTLSQRVDKEDVEIWTTLNTNYSVVFRRGGNSNIPVNLAMNFTSTNTINNPWKVNG